MPSKVDDLLDVEPDATIDPYEILDLPKRATADEVKRSYRKAALKHHPDKVHEDQKLDAHKHFQQIALAFAILSDPDRRKRYDRTGSTEEVIDSDDFNWSDFYRVQFENAISVETLAAFSEEYRTSDEEQADLIAAYEEHEGDMDAVFESVMLSNVLEDENRFRAIIDQAISAGEVEEFSKYRKESQAKRNRRRKAAEREAEEAMEMAREMGLEQELFGDASTEKGQKGTKNKMKKGTKEGDEEALMALIQSRQKDRAQGFLERLEEKYAGPAKRRGPRGTRPTPDSGEPDEEAFRETGERAKRRRTEKINTEKPASTRKSRAKAHRTKDDEE